MIPMWTDRGSGSHSDVSLWMAVCPTGYSALGIVANPGYGLPNAGDWPACIKQKYLILVSVNNIVPSIYHRGIVITLLCVHLVWVQLLRHLLQGTAYYPVWNDRGSGSNQDVSVWGIASPSEAHVSKQFVANGM